MLSTAWFFEKEKEFENLELYALKFSELANGSNAVCEYDLSKNNITNKMSINILTNYFSQFIYGICLYTENKTTVEKK